MDTLSKALLAGLVFGLVDLFFVYTTKFKSQKMKREVMMTVFVQRFGTGFVIPYISLSGVPHSVTGAVIAFIFSLPLAIQLKRYAPLMGVLIGLIIGLLT